MGGKAALNRARTKLAASADPPKPSPRVNPELTRVLRLYVERFNRHDWNGLRELISVDARLRVVDAFSGRLSDSPYFGNYELWSMPWEMATGEVDGEPVVIVMRSGAETCAPYAVVRISRVRHQIESIVDYAHCLWMIPAAASITVASSL